SDALPGAGSAAAEEAHRHGERFETWTLTSDRPLSRQALERFAREVPGGIARATGFVVLAEAPEQPQLFQLVGHRWSLEPREAGSILPKATWW
ncbi:MAG: GTP-binding protein, partial [Cyanobium sp.]